MEQLEVLSWKTLDALKDAASKIVEVIGDLDAFEHMSIFCQIDDDHIELYYSELDSNYIRHFENEEEFTKCLAVRKNEFGEEDFDSMDYYDEESNYEDEDSDENYNGYNIKDGEEDDEF
jgi:hypothetical protein